MRRPSHYGDELRLVATASRRLVEKLVALDGQEAPDRKGTGIDASARGGQPGTRCRGHGERPVSFTRRGHADVGSGAVHAGREPASGAGGEPEPAGGLGWARHPAEAEQSQGRAAGENVRGGPDPRAGKSGEERGGGHAGGRARLCWDSTSFSPARRLARRWC